VRVISPLASLLVAVVLTAATDPSPWLERVFQHLQAGRHELGSEAYERRPALDEAARKYAEDIAGRPHSERLRQRTSIDRFLEANGIEHFHHARLHLDMGKGYRDWGDKFSRSWTAYEMAWKNATDPRYDAIGLAAAEGDDGWVVLVGILVDDVKIPKDLAAVERRALDGVNAIRVEHGLGLLEHHDGLADLARRYSEQMIRDGFFAHKTPDGVTLEHRVKVAGIRYRSVAENLHKSKGYDDPVPVALAGWMDSEGHRKNLLGEQYTHSGIGVAIAEDGYVYFTQLFMLPLNP